MVEIMRRSGSGYISIMACLAVILVFLFVTGCGSTGGKTAEDAGDEAWGTNQEAADLEEGGEAVENETDEAKGTDESPGEGFAFDEVSGGTEGVMVLKDVRFGDHPGYERVVLEFTAPQENPGGGTPLFRARYLQPPYRDAELNTVSIKGSYLVELHFAGNKADLSVPEGYKIVYEGPDDFSPGLTVIREAKLVPAYELNGMILLIGLGERAAFRVEEDLGPPRIIIDIKK